LHSY